LPRNFDATLPWPAEYLPQRCRNNLAHFAANFRTYYHEIKPPVYRDFAAYLLRIYRIFTANLLRIYRIFNAHLPCIWRVFTTYLSCIYRCREENRLQAELTENGDSAGIRVKTADGWYGRRSGRPYGPAGLKGIKRRS
jgi:hypothetical protein